MKLKKSLWLLLSLWLLCLSGCRPKPYPSLLLAADSLASVLPDSACALLASYAADTARCNYNYALELDAYLEAMEAEYAPDFTPPELGDYLE